MFNNFSEIIKKITSFLNYIAQICIFSVMILMVGNVLLRTFLNKPIRGTYDIVSLMYIMIISFSIAYCSLKDGHVSVNYFMQKISLKAQKVIDIVINSIFVIFFISISWNILKYANYIKGKRECTMTTLTPYYPFIYVIGAGIILMTIVIIMKLIFIIKKKAGDNS